MKNSSNGCKFLSLGFTHSPRFPPWWRSQLRMWRLNYKALRSFSIHRSRRGFWCDWSWLGEITPISTCKLIHHVVNPARKGLIIESPPHCWLDLDCKLTMKSPAWSVHWLDMLHILWQDEDNPSRTTLRSTIDSWLKDFFAMATVMVRHCLVDVDWGWVIGCLISGDIYIYNYILYLIYSLHARESENLVHELIHHWLSCNIYMNYRLIFVPCQINALLL